ncbi:MAG: Gfo/Idh/MocA family protein, partial [Plesiomonas shigelloides]
MVIHNKGMVNVAVVGLGYGVHFLPIYLDHPNVGDVDVVDVDAKLAADAAASHGIEACYGDISSMLRDKHWDAVHILAPVQFHADCTRRVLRSGKHCACVVLMVTTLEDLADIVSLQRDTGLRYMMMETSAYTRELLTAHQAFDGGELGRITMYEGFHLQNLREYPTYWQGFPPMHYATHALSPILKLTSVRVVSVAAHGGGELAEDNRIGGYVNNFGVECGLFNLSTPDIIVK